MLCFILFSCLSSLRALQLIDSFPCTLQSGFTPHVLSVVTLPSSLDLTNLNSQFNRIQHILLNNILFHFDFWHRILLGFLLLNFLFFLSLPCGLSFKTRTFFFFTIGMLQDSVFSPPFFPPTSTHFLGDPSQLFQVFLFSISVTFNSTVLSDWCELSLILLYFTFSYPLEHPVLNFENTSKIKLLITSLV